MLIRRSEELRNMVENRKKVIERIELAQEKQKEVQNKRTKRVIRTFLQKDTVVYRKNDGMISKSEPRWIGPYKIFDNDERGNYSLIDSTGEGTIKKYPLDKLKIVDQEQLEEDTNEIQKIMADRTKNNEIEYKVLWKDNTIDWINEKDFQTIEIINDYWRVKATGKDKRQRGRPRKVNMV